MLPLLVFLLFFVASCGGGGEQAQQPPPPDPAKDAGGAPKDAPKDGGQAGGGTAGEAKAPAAGGAGGGNAPGGATVASGAQAETLEDAPFTLNQRQPVPQDFRQAYQRRALIVVQFSKEEADASQEAEVPYPQGIRPDEEVNQDLRSLRREYQDQGVEFFTYDISRPGNAETSEELNGGEYGSLAAQLEVGFTPFVAMLAPRGEGYVVENLFQGYVEEGVLDQALYDLVSTDVRGNSSDVDVTVEQVELTESGGAIEYFTVVNRGSEEVDLSGFVLNAVDQETGDTKTGSQGLRIQEGVTLAPGERASIGRAADLTDADGREVVGTFSGSESLAVQAGDQVALLDGSAGGGAVVDNITVE